MTNPLNVHLARLATQRAHIAGAEAADLEAEANNPPEDHPDPEPFQLMLRHRAAAARRRYWRELEHAALLTGHRWEAAEWLGGAA